MRLWRTKTSLTLAQVAALVKLSKKVDKFNSLLSGEGPPSSQGTEGDFYIDITTKRLYGPKGENGWSAIHLLRLERAILMVFHEGNRSKSW